MIRLGTVVVGVEDVERGVTFWSPALGYDPVSFEGAEDGFTVLVPPGGVGTRLAVRRSATAPQAEPRVHIDLIVDSSDEQSAEVERLIRLGASRAPWKYPTDPDFVVLSDPDGNCFCVVDASHG
jgi:catechol 2,3-dioxygenase-like lactoylglutathione lyase family enzyme